MSAPSLSGGTIIAAVRVIAWIELTAAILGGGVCLYKWQDTQQTNTTTVESRARGGVVDADTRQIRTLGARARASQTPGEWLQLGLWAIIGGVTTALLLLLLVSMAENLAVLRYEAERHR